MCAPLVGGGKTEEGGSEVVVYMRALPSPTLSVRHSSPARGWPLDPEDEAAYCGTDQISHTHLQQSCCLANHHAIEETKTIIVLLASSSLSSLPREIEQTKSRFLKCFPIWLSKKIKLSLDHHVHTSLILVGYCIDAVSNEYQGCVDMMCFCLFVFLFSSYFWFLIFTFFFFIFFCVFFVSVALRWSHAGCLVAV